jgi:hypothetical protein
MSWPSREEWAKQRRTPYGDLMPEISDRISDYATPAEVEALEAALHERWKELGRTLRTCADESDAAEIRDRRQGINRARRLIASGELPHHLEDHFGAQDLMAPFVERWREAQTAAYAAAAGRIAQTPIDDEAWAGELVHRARVDAWLGRAVVSQ